MSTTLTDITTKLSQIIDEQIDAKKSVLSINGNLPDSAGNITMDKLGCLPLTGGTLTGTTKSSSNAPFQAINSSHADYGYSYGDRTGALMAFRASEYTNNPGGFEVFARTSTQSISFTGKIDGTLMWNGKNVVRSVNNTAADINGNVTLSTGVLSAQAYITQTYNSGSNWYRVWSDGFIEQGGLDTTTWSGSSGRTITFHKAFSTQCCSVVASLYNSYVSNTTGVTNITSVSKTNFVIKANNGITNKGVYWYACGY